MGKIEKAIAPADRVIWMHCASLGEFEQGRPLLEALREQYPRHRLLLTFFSPSGYEVQRHYQGADWVFYLPLDGPRTAKRFLQATHPELVIFVKYEFWYFYLKKISYQKIPLLLVAALFRKDMNFFSWYGGLSRKMASRFDRLFVQNSSSLQLLEQIGLGAISTVAGDTRYDRVVTIARSATPVAAIEEFSQGAPLLVAGSTWPEDEEALKALIESPTMNGIKLVIAPHEIDSAHIQQLLDLFSGAVLLSQWKQPVLARVLIIDNYGMLSSLYRYATIAYIGGGLRKMGVHNTLEAAVYGVPLVFGQYYTKYAEAVALVQAGAAFAFTPAPHYPSLIDCAGRLLHDTALQKRAGQQAALFVKGQCGATDIIMRYVQEKRLLSN